VIVPGSATVTYRTAFLKTAVSLVRQLYDKVTVLIGDSCVFDHIMVMPVLLRVRCLIRGYLLLVRFPSSLRAISPAVKGIRAVLHFIEVFIQDIVPVDAFAGIHKVQGAITERIAYPEVKIG